jgi:hypothetical protein
MGFRRHAFRLPMSSHAWHTPQGVALMAPLPSVPWQLSDMRAILRAGPMCPLPRRGASISPYNIG